MMTRIPRRQRHPKLTTPETLEKAALWYLERYATSSANLERVLMRRVHRSIAVHGGDADALADAVRAIVARFQRAGLLDDHAYADARARGLLRQGKGRRFVARALSAKGIDASLAADVLADIVSEQDDPGDLDLAAAINYARRRRIGPWRRENRAANRDRDLAALGRQGHDLDTARRVVDAADAAALEAVADSVGAGF